MIQIWRFEWINKLFQEKLVLEKNLATIFIEVRRGSVTDMEDIEDGNSVTDLARGGKLT